MRVVDADAGGSATLGSVTGWVGQPPGGVDQSDVGERLREVAELPAGDQVDLLGKQPDVVGVPDDPLERAPAPGPARPPSSGTPPARTSRAGNHAGSAAPAPDQPVRTTELPLDRRDGGPHPGVGGGQEPHHRQIEHRGVQLVRTERTRVRPDPLVPALVQDGRADLVADRRPPLRVGPATEPGASRTARCRPPSRAPSTRGSAGPRPRVSHIPRSGRRQVAATCSVSPTHHVPQLVVELLDRGSRAAATPPTRSHRVRPS